MKFKSILDLPCGMREVYNNLNLSSSLSVQLLLDSEIITSHSKLTDTYSLLSDIYHFSLENNIFTDIENIKLLLSELRDIRNTISALSSGKVLDDIEFFEIKNLIILLEKVKPYLDIFPKPLQETKELSRVMNILDPEDKRIPSFYIYDSYDENLAELRRVMKSRDEIDEDLYSQLFIIEERVRKELSAELSEFADDIKSTLIHLAEVDIILSKVLLIKEWGLSFPRVSKYKTDYNALFNPVIRKILKESGKVYQSVSIAVDSGSPIILTGANMGGKSVTLKTMALAQYMFQFGLGVPAIEAEVMPVYHIYLVDGDYQDINRGLSSFAAEMKRIDRIIKESCNTPSILVLLDEPARTTNPVEGKALVESLLKILKNKKPLTVVATHYNVEVEGFTRMRVKGIDNGIMNYELIYTSDTEAPKEAINIARSLNISPEWIDEAEKLISLDT